MVRAIDVAALKFDVLRSATEWEAAPASRDIVEAQKAILDAQHLVFVFPLWLGALPALLKAFLEQVLRPGLAFDVSKGPFRGRLKGRSSRVIVTMGMPAWIYRWWFGARAVKSFEQGILRFVGIKPNRLTLIGSLGSDSEYTRKAWLAEIARLGRAGR